MHVIKICFLSFNDSGWCLCHQLCQWWIHSLWVLFRVALVSWLIQRGWNNRSARGCSRQGQSDQPSISAEVVAIVSRQPRSPPASGCRWQESQLVWATGKQGRSVSVALDSWDRLVLLMAGRIQGLKASLKKMGVLFLKKNLHKGFSFTGPV